eukprot:m.33750 g.33750  ORF g.33750 m.33750 type:complete len:425 (-) comp16866_c1_seq2:591-1865(-)
MKQRFHGVSTRGPRPVVIPDMSRFDFTAPSIEEMENPVEPPLTYPTRTDTSFSYTELKLPTPNKPTVAHTRNTPTSFKTRLFSMWNNAVNAQYFKPKFAIDSPIWLLGEVYGHSAIDYDSKTQENRDPDHLVELMSDIYSRYWLSYREGFPIIPNSKYSSDVGWGCMLRSGQMLLAQALLMCCLGRGFRVHAQGGNLRKHDEIIKLFDDTLSEGSPYSVHHLLRIGSSYGVKPGAWLGPSSVCTALSRAVNAVGYSEIYGHLGCYVALDCMVSKAAIQKLTDSNDPNDPEFRPVLILVPLRLGVEKLNTLYITALQTVFSYKECVGMMGGKPGHSLYFIGFQDGEMIGLDPHKCQQCFDIDETADSTINQSFHSTTPRKVKFVAVDPSMAIGFVCRSQAELERFYQLSNQAYSSKALSLYSIEP